VFKNLGISLGGVVAPPRCMGCLREETWLCARCRRDIAKLPLSCVVCGKDKSRGVTCFDCRDETLLKGLVSVGPYSSTALRRGIHWLKFKGVKGSAESLAKLLIPRLKVIATLSKLQRDAALVPVPLHKRRLRQRGFNQSSEIAQVIEQYTGIPVMNVLMRHKSTWTQTKLPPELREENMNNAFTLREVSGLKDKRLLIIVDDVTTTGSTLSAAAKPLKGTGIKEVWGLTVARG
jgi:competence protein ComFC